MILLIYVVTHFDVEEKLCHQHLKLVANKNLTERDIRTGRLFFGTNFTYRIENFVRNTMSY